MKSVNIFFYAIFLFYSTSAQTTSEITIYFQVNMELEIAAEKFINATDTLFTRSSLNNWSDIVVLTRSNADTNIYEGSAQFESFDGDMFYYKYGYTTINGTNWEGGDSHYYIVSATDITNHYIILPVLGYNIFGGTEGINLHETKIRFVVDMNNAVDWNGKTFTSIDNVVLAGASSPIELFGLEWPDSDSNKVLFMSDDGTNGDETADDDLWTKEVTFPIYTSSTIQYKYGANWGLTSNGGTNDNETGMYGLHHFVNTFIFNHTYIDFWCGDAIDVFGTMGHKDIVNNVEQISSGIPTIYKLEQNYPNPFNPSTTIAYSIPNDGSRETSKVKLIVYDVLGNEIATLVNEQQSAGFYEVKFDAKNLTSGIYIYRLQSGNFSQSKKMIFVK